MGFFLITAAGAWISKNPYSLIFNRINQIADKVKLFFFEHARNRHKMTTLTPAYHAVCDAQ